VVMDDLTAHKGESGFAPFPRFFRESDEPRPGSRPVNRVSFQAAAA
jgi:hypothetical protein